MRSRRVCNNKRSIKYYQQKRIKMSRASTNCLVDCLKCNQEQGCLSPPFKNKKGRKCLTLVKNTRDRQPLRVHTTNESTTLERARVQDINLQKQYAINTLTKRSKSTDQPISDKRPAIIWDRLSQPRSIKTIISPAYYAPQAPRVQERRSSLRMTPNVPFAYRSLEARSISQKTKASVLQEQNRKFPLTNKMNQNKIKRTYQKPQHLNSISPIIQEEERERRSSLFQGAKSIISKLISSQKKDTIEFFGHGSFQTAKKEDKQDLKGFYDNVRLCETQQLITYTTSSIGSDPSTDSPIQHKIQINNICHDSIPMSPSSNNKAQFRDFKMGKLLGVGKWAHAYLCEEKYTHSIYAIKEIFKHSMDLPASIDKISSKTKRIMNLNHPKVMNIYSKFETADKLCLIMEYCTKPLYELLKQRTQLPLSLVKCYLIDLIQAIVFLHENDIIHSNITAFQIYVNFSECKIKPSITSAIVDGNLVQDFQEDIDSLVIIAYEMTYGFIGNENKDTLFERQRSYCDAQSKKKKLRIIKQSISQPQTRVGFNQINDFFEMLLNWSQGSRLASGLCLNHLFFKYDYVC